MRYLVVPVAATVALWLMGCSGQRTAQAPSDVFGSMKKELSQSLVEADAFDAMDDALAHAIGTTTLTSSETIKADDDAPGPKPLQTWGVSPEDTLEDPFESEADPGEVSRAHE